MPQEIHHFNDLLAMAHEQPDKQRLLFVFAGAELPENASAEERADFARGAGGALVPLMCADKLPEELQSWETLTAEASEFEHPSHRWELVFAAALGGSLIDPPSEEQAEAVLNRMIEGVKTGMTDAYLPFNRAGEPVQLMGRGGARKPGEYAMQPNRYPRARITGGILAGGRGTRMGGVDKGLVLLAGLPLVEHVRRALAPQVGAFLISANRNPDRYAGYGVPVLRDADDGFLGPLAGVERLLQAAPTDWLLIVPCDGPLLPADLGERLWRAAADQGTDIAAAHDGESVQPTYALLHRRLLGSLRAYLTTGHGSACRWYREHRIATVDFSDCPRGFTNLNTLDERDRLAATLRSPVPTEAFAAWE